MGREEEEEGAAAPAEGFYTWVKVSGRSSSNGSPGGGCEDHPAPRTHLGLISVRVLLLLGGGGEPRAPLLAAAPALGPCLGRGDGEGGG